MLRVVGRKAPLNPGSGQAAPSRTSVALPVGTNRSASLPASVRSTANGIGVEASAASGVRPRTPFANTAVSVVGSSVTCRSPNVSGDTASVPRRSAISIGGRGAIPVDGDRRGVEPGEVGRRDRALQPHRRAVDDHLVQAAVPDLRRRGGLDRQLLGMDVGVPRHRRRRAVRLSLERFVWQVEHDAPDRLRPADAADRVLHDLVAPRRALGDEDPHQRQRDHQADAEDADGDHLEDGGSAGVRRQWGDGGHARALLLRLETRRGAMPRPGPISAAGRGATRAGGGRSGAGLWRDCGGGVKSPACLYGADRGHRRGRGRHPRIGRLRARARRARGGRLRRRTARLERLRGGAARSRHPRHRPARHGRPRAVPPPALALRGAADRLPHLARGGVRSRARPRDRRRRLPVQAVLDARADGPRQGAAAARLAGPRAEPGASPGSARGRARGRAQIPRR